MHELTPEDLEFALDRLETTVWVKLTFRRNRANKTPHRFAYEKRLLRSINAVYDSQIRAWKVPDSTEHAPTLAYMLEKTSAVIYETEAGEEPEAEWF